MSICQSQNWFDIDRQIRKNLGIPQFASSHQDFDDMSLKERDDFDPLAVMIPSRVASIDLDTRLGDTDRYADFF